MVLTTSAAARPPPRSTQSHSHSHSHSQSHRSPKSSTTPLSPTRIAASVGQALPPNLNSYLRSPGPQTEVRTPSPNYFGHVVNPTTDPRDSLAGPKDNWSPPSSSIRSFGGASPEHIPIDANPEFEAFRRQTEERHGFNLGHGNLSHFASTPSAQPRLRPERRPARTDTQEQSPKSRPQQRNEAPKPMLLDNGGQIQSPTTSLNAPSFFDIPRQQSPIHMSESNPSIQRNMLSNLDDRHPRLSLPQNKADPPSPHLQQTRSNHARADTLPSSLEDGPVFISPEQLKDILDHVPIPQFLLLDLRVVHQFSKSRIKGSLNLCIPTTLLKRPSFNLAKLQDTFTIQSENARFREWRVAKYIIVYDSLSSEKKDAVSAMNTLKKFTNEAWQGNAYILRGGFAEFQKQYPRLVENGLNNEQSSKNNLSLGSLGPDVAPVAGGCVMPTSKSAANPFFNNIRQNQDLIGGVGQEEIKIPKELTDQLMDLVPNWLRKVANKDDRGKLAAEKFTVIEKSEQARIFKAIQSGVSYGTPSANKNGVQLAGIEKGSKNRYNNIWPFEHTRVKLQGRSPGSCDYINASHITSSRSNKQYIASQGPLPATFSDFWSVVWDQDVRVIVMLTAESEGGQLKCHPYWESQDYGPMKLKPLSEKKMSLDIKSHRTSSDRRDSGRRRANTLADSAPNPTTPEPPHAVIRKFTLAHSAHPFSPIREITQVHYSSWPDFGAPANSAQLLGLVELTNRLQRSATAPTQSTRFDEPESDEVVHPILVHCSAGVGRTGTFCTIDSVIDMLKRQRKEQKSGVTPMEISSGDYMGKGQQESVSGDWVFEQDTDLVQKTVEDFRTQRISMVQSLRQYVLCYETVLEWIAQQHFGSAPTRERSGSDLGQDRRPQ